MHDELGILLEDNTIIEHLQNVGRGPEWSTSKETIQTNNSIFPQH